MTTITYTCDKCNKQVDNPQELFELALVLTRYGNNTTNIKAQEWCRECLLSHGIVAWRDDAIPKPPAPPTLEDMLVQFIDQRIDEKNYQS